MSSSNEPSVGIVLVNYNGLKFMNDCVRTIKNITYRNFEIIVVDNASTDGSMEALGQEFPDVTTLYSPDNLGITDGNNRGIKYCLDKGHDYILLLNNDTEVTEDFLSTLVAFSLEKGRCLVTPKIYFHDNKKLINNNVGVLNWITGETKCYFYGKADSEKSRESIPVEVTSTCCLLIPAEVFNHIGLMDNDYFMYYDDTDFVFRAWEYGHKVYFHPQAVIYHKESSSTGGNLKSNFKTYYVIRNRLLFMKKHNNNLARKILFHLYFWGKMLAKLGFLLAKRNFTALKVNYMAVSDSLNGRFQRRDNIPR